MSRLFRFFTQVVLISMFILPLVVTVSSLDALLSASMTVQTQAFRSDIQDRPHLFISRPSYDDLFGQTIRMDFIPLESF